MATRPAGGYNAPYDPREWVSSSRQTSMALEEGHHVSQPEGMCLSAVWETEKHG
jgi:hypothetical protein